MTGVLAVLGSELDVEYLRATLNPLERYVVLVDDAEMLYNAGPGPPGRGLLFRPGRAEPVQLAVAE